MAKTLIAAKHELGPAINGHDNCYARFGNGGMCPGHKTAEWLNGLGEDEEPYTSQHTNGDVRMNWLRGSGHIIACDSRLAELRAEERRTAANLRRVRKEIKKLEAGE
jgi:hypothetical protein